MSYYITPTEERQRELRRHWFLKNRHLYFFKAKPLKLLSKYERWKKIAKLLKLSKLACQRLEWIIYYETKAKRDAAFTARHFGISRKTFYKWFNRFQDGRNFPGLEDQDRAPKRKRQREITPLEEERIINIRKKKKRKRESPNIVTRFARKLSAPETLGFWRSSLARCFPTRGNTHCSHTAQFPQPLSVV